MLFFFNDTATTEIYTLSLHDALPICRADREQLGSRLEVVADPGEVTGEAVPDRHDELRADEDHQLAGLDGLPLVDVDRKSTRLNSSHANISYAVFCL